MTSSFYCLSDISPVRKIIVKLSLAAILSNFISLLHVSPVSKTMVKLSLATDSSEHGQLITCQGVPDDRVLVRRVGDDLVSSGNDSHAKVPWHVLKTLHVSPCRSIPDSRGLVDRVGDDPVSVWRDSHAPNALGTSSETVN